MSDGTDGPVGSGAMEATPAVDPTFGHHHDPESLVEALEMEPTEVAPISLGRRLTQPRTILSIIVPLAIIGFFLYLNRERLAAVPTLILQANPALVLLAAIVFYLGFPLRGYRWQRLLRETGFIIGLRNSTEILYISWFVNCVVPAKLGDVYRAYLLKMNSDASLSRTFGTVFIERILDIFAIAILGLAAGFWSFRLGMPPAVRIVFVVGIVTVIVAGVGLFTMRNFGRRILTRLPLPPSVLELYERFEEGVFGAVGLRHLPMLAFVTGLIWLTEGLRLYIVVLAFGFPDVELGLSGAIFVALIGSLLTAIPLSPAGLGFAQAGVIGVLTVAYGVPLPEATAITILDWVISVLSIIVFGAVTYVVSPMPRGMGRIPQPPTAPAGDLRLTRPAIQTGSRGRTKVMGSHPRAPRPDRDGPHRTASYRAARPARGDRYQRVIQTSRGPIDSGFIALIPRSIHRSAQAPHDDPERPSVQRMASSSAQGQEDVATAARTAVGGGSLHDLAADPRRSHAVSRDGDQAGPRPPRASRRRGHAAVPGPRRGRQHEPDGTRRIRAPRR